jgi:outer membrane receptor protein involved in Fe transport
MRASMQEKVRRTALRGLRFRRSRLCGVAALLLALVAARAGAQEPAPDSDEGQDDGVEAVSGVEVLQVRGRGAGAIETEVPASITQFDASTIQALGAQDISDLSRVTPNVSIVQPGATQATFFVRGIGLSDFNANAAGAVTILQDDVVLNAPAIQTGQIFDVRDVEIVRGPQGTGPFRNASAGAIRVSSNLPTGNYGSQMRASIGRYAADGGKGAHHGLIQDYEGALEAPIATDLLSTRMAFRMRRSDPYQTNGCGNAKPFEERANRPAAGQGLDALDICGERGRAMWPVNQKSRIPVGLDDEVDLEDSWAARGFLRFQPPESDLDFVLNVHGSRLDEDQTFGQAIGTGRVPGRPPFFGGGAGSETPAYQEPDQQLEVNTRCGSTSGPPCVAFPNPILDEFARVLAEKRPLDRKPYRGDYDRAGETTRDTWGGYLSAKGEIRDYDWLVVGSYDAYDRFRDQDTDFTPDILFETVETDDSWQTFEMVQIGGELEWTLLEWQVGAYYLYEELDSDSVTNLASENRIERSFTQDTTSVAPWAKFKWDFLDDVTLEAGLRWNWEKKDFELSRRLASGPDSTAEADEAIADKTWHTTTGTVNLTYHFTPSASAFAKYSRGFKAGHFNALTGDEVDRPPAEPEYNDAWEAGIAGSWLDRRLSGTVSYFYYRYEDYQIFLFRTAGNDPPVLEIVNAAQAENYGLELEGTLLPLRGWVPRTFEDLRLNVNLGWLHGEFLDFQQRSRFGTAGETFPITLDFSGQQMLSSPEFKVAGAANWTFDLGRWGSLLWRYDFSWTDDVFFGLNEGRGTGTVDIQGTPRLPAFAVGQPAYWLHNLRAGYRLPTGNVEIAVFCRNIEDTVYKTYAFDASSFSNVAVNFVGTPRTIGVDVIVTF